MARRGGRIRQLARGDRRGQSTADLVAEPVRQRTHSRRAAAVVRVSPAHVRLRARRRSRSWDGAAALRRVCTRTSVYVWTARLSAGRDRVRDDAAPESTPFRASNIGLQTDDAQTLYCRSLSRPQPSSGRVSAAGGSRTTPPAVMPLPVATGSSRTKRRVRDRDDLRHRQSARCGARRSSRG